MNMTYSKNGLDLTEQFESCRLMPYQDSAGVWTDGYGNTHNVVPGFAITQAKADADLLANVQDAVDCVNDSVRVLLTQEEFDALVDFTFNVGCSAFRNSTLLRLLNAGDFKAAASQLVLWDHAGGKVLAGLLRRREAEQAEFNQPEGGTTA